MQETDFILQNKDKWKEFEEVLKSNNKDPERLTDLFIETTDDLSYSRTNYPNRSVRVYLNGIAQLVYQAIYKNKEKDTRGFARFWRVELPEAMWVNRKALYYSFFLFLAGLTVGLMSSIYYPDFAKIVLGESYIGMTEANIASGDPMAVYKDSEPLIMFFQIAWNNIIIAYGTFILGILFGIGTIYVVFYNAIMVGTFIYFFIERGLFKESMLAIMLHGTLELSMIVVAGCAGFALAKGILFPGTFSRGEALMISARSGIKILLGVTVLLIYAAIIESFATRYTEMPDYIRGSIIILSLMLVVGYFVWYPYYRFKNGLIKDAGKQDDTPKTGLPISINYIKATGKIFTETFSLFAGNARILSIMAFCASLVIAIVFGFATKGDFNELNYSDNSIYNPLSFIYPWNAFNGHLDFEKFPVVFFLLVILFAVYMLVVFYLADRQIKNQHGVEHTTFYEIKFRLRTMRLSNLAHALVIALISASPLLLPHTFTFFTMLFSLPICMLWCYVAIKEKLNLVESFRKTFLLIKGNYWKLAGTFLSTLAIQWICYFILSSDIINLILEFISTNIPSESVLSKYTYIIFYTLLLFFIPSFLISLSLFGTVLLYYSLLEMNTAEHLIDSIEKIGFKKRAYGLEKEM